MMHKRENEKEIKKQPYLKHTALYFQLRFSNGFSVRIFVGDFFKILLKIYTENPTENNRTHFDIWGRFAQNPYKKSY